MNKTIRLILSLSIIMIVVLSVVGCKSGEVKKRPRRNVPLEGTPQALGETIGELCELQGYESVRVLGWSLVCGLPGTGSADCPPSAKAYLIQVVRRLKETGYFRTEYEGLSAEEIIGSDTTAVVQVSGTVPPGAPKGTIFDIEVFIPWSTQTTSLQGGILIPTDLRIVVPGQTGSALAGRTTAYAGGQVFIRTFLDLEENVEVSSTARNLRGVILGGARSIYNRQIQLAIMEPDSSVAQQMQRRINLRFPNELGPKVANATRYSISITVPDNYKDNYDHFIRVLLGLYLEDSLFSQQRIMNELNDMALKKDADYEAIAIAWEAIGRHSLDYLEQIYSPMAEKEYDPKLVYYAARASLNQQDRRAIDALIRIAVKDEHPCQLLAIKELSRVADDLRARSCLSRLIDHPNQAVRLLTYEGLRNINSLKIKSLNVKGAFDCDVVQTLGDTMICVWTYDKPRITVFGENLVCRRNVFYEVEDKTITVNAGENDSLYTISRRLDGGKRFASAKSSRQLERFIETLSRPVDPKNKKAVPGAGLTFSQIVEVLYDLCEENVIPARFVFVKSEGELLQGDVATE